MFRKWFKSKPSENKQIEQPQSTTSSSHTVDPFNFVHSGVVEYFRKHSGNGWNVDTETRQSIGELLAQSYINAYNVPTTVDSLKPYLDMSGDEIEVFIRTEYSRAFQHSNKIANVAAGVEKVRYLATIDNKTCPECMSRHNKIYPLSQAPNIPCHDGCRCMTVSEF